MAQLENFGGWNTGHTAEGSPNKWVNLTDAQGTSFNTPWPYLNQYYFTVGEGSSGRVPEMGLLKNSTGSSDTFMTFAAYIRFENLPSTTRNFIEFQDWSVSTRNHAQLQLNSSGDLDLLDSAGTSQATASAAIAADKWYLLEVEIQYHNTTGSITAYLDRVQVATASPIDTVSGLFSGFQVNCVGAVAGASSQSWYLSNFYVYSDTAALPARLGHFHVISYVDDEAAVTGDFGSALDVGDWGDLADDPPDETNFAKYQDSGDSGVVETSYNGGNFKSGPKNDARVGTIIAGQWFHMYEFNSVFGSQFLRFNYGAGDGSDTTVSQTVVSSPSSRGDTIVESGTNVPTKWEFAQYGFGVTGTSSPINIELEGAQCNLLIVPRDNITLGRGFPKGGGEDVLVWTGG